MEGYCQNCSDFSNQLLVVGCTHSFCPMCWSEIKTLGGELCPICQSKPENPEPIVEGSVSKVLEFQYPTLDLIPKETIHSRYRQLLKEDQDNTLLTEWYHSALKTHELNEELLALFQDKVQNVRKLASLVSEESSDKLVSTVWTLMQHLTQIQFYPNPLPQAQWWGRLSFTSNRDYEKWNRVRTLETPFRETIMGNDITHPWRIESISPDGKRYFKNNGETNPFLGSFSDGSEIEIEKGLVRQLILTPNGSVTLDHDFENDPLFVEEGGFTSISIRDHSFNPLKQKSIDNIRVTGIASDGKDIFLTGGPAYGDTYQIFRLNLDLEIVSTSVNLSGRMSPFTYHNLILGKDRIYFLEHDRITSYNRETLTIDTDLGLQRPDYLLTYDSPNDVLCLFDSVSGWLVVLTPGLEEIGSIDLGEDIVCDRIQMGENGEIFVADEQQICVY